MRASLETRMPKIASPRARLALHVRLAGAAIGAGLLGASVLGAAQAQTATPSEPRGTQALPPLERLPDGFAVTPSRPLQEMAPPGVGDSAAPAEPGRRPAPGHQPHGGCRYDDQKLELIV